MDEITRNNLGIYSTEEIEKLVRKLPTSRKRINARKRIKNMTNAVLDKLIAENKELLRSLRSESEGAKRSVYAKISQYERLKHEIKY